jgi:hypothetical protein
MLSIKSATSSISRLSSSSASSAATSAAKVARFRRRPALSRIARRIASDLLIPVASSWASACNASGSRRTLIAEDIARAYHKLSYRISATAELKLGMWSSSSTPPAMARPWYDSAVCHSWEGSQAPMGSPPTWGFVEERAKGIEPS